MNEPRLDRLSALLAGLQPRVWLSNATQALSLHILQRRMEHHDTPATPSLDGLTLRVCPPGRALNLDTPGTVAWMSFEVAFDGPVGDIFLDELRDVLDIDLAQADPSLRQIVQLIASEMQAPRCGQPLLLDRAGDILLIGLLRQLVSSPQPRLRLFNGLADPRIARTLVLMHTDPAQPWTLDSLATEAGMSRTSFANRFKAVMRVPAGKYLETLRLAIAHRRVAQGQGLKQVAREVGYAGASTLSRAMHRMA